jgi:hypothetical protein
VVAASAAVLAPSRLGAAGRLAGERVTLAATLDAKLLTALFTEPAWLHADTMQTAMIIHPARTHFAAVLRMARLLFWGGISPSSLTRSRLRAIAQER